MASGAISGASAGAALGSVVPGLGTAAGAIIGGVAGLGGDIANYFTNKGSAKKQYKYNKQLMYQQNAYNIENWRMQNDYNLPSAQRARLKAAGLNPDLMYQNGASGLTAASAAPVSGSSVSQQAPSDFHGLANGAILASQLADVQADIELKKSQAGEHRANEERIRKDLPSEAGSNVIDDFFVKLFPENSPENQHGYWNSDYTDFSLTKDETHTIPGDNNYSTIVHYTQKDLDNLQKILQYSRDLSAYDAEKSQNNLAKRVADGRLRSTDVTHALINMPSEEYKKVVNENSKILSDIDVNNAIQDYYGASSDNQRAQADLARFEKRLKQDSNFASILRKIFDGWDAMPTKEKLFNVLTLGFTLASMR